MHGEGRFTGPHALQVGDTSVTFDHAIVAAGSRAVRLPGIPHDDPRVVDSTGALELADVPERLLVVGGGIIGLEMATVYDALGSAGHRRRAARPAHPGLRPGPRQAAAQAHGRALRRRSTSARSVESIEAREDGLHATFSDGVEPAIFDRVLVAVGRIPNGADLGLDAAGVHVDERGFVPVDDQRRTNVPHIFAIGDVVGRADARPQGDARGEGRRRGHRRARRRVRRPRRSRRSPTPSRRSPGSA